MRFNLERDTFKDEESDKFSVACVTIWPIGAFPTKYVCFRSPMTDSKAVSAHWKHIGFVFKKRRIR